MMFYDPPSGWMYGFPKPYLPLVGETLKETLIRDGYPEEEVTENIRCRFWEAGSVSPQEVRDNRGSIS